MEMSRVLCVIAAVAAMSAAALQATQAASGTTGKKHPQPNAVVQPTAAGGPAHGAGPNSHGYFENMTPGGLAHGDDGEHETTHPVGGKAPLIAAHPASGNAVQQPQPAMPQ